MPTIQFQDESGFVELPDQIPLGPDDPFSRTGFRATTRQEIRSFLTDRFADAFPDLAEQVRGERENKIQLQTQLDDQRSSRRFSNIRETLLEAIDPRLRIFEETERIEDDLTIALQRQLPEAAFELQLPSGRKFFPTPSPELVDPETGDPTGTRLFQPIRGRKAIIAGFNQNPISRAGQRILGAEEFVPTFEPNGLFEGVTVDVSNLYSRLPVFFAGGTAASAASGGLKGMGVVGAFAADGAVDSFIVHQLENGLPSNFDESLALFRETSLSTSKGALTGMALFGGQAAGGVLASRALGLPARFLPKANYLNRMAVNSRRFGRSAGQFIGGVTALGTVPSVLEDEYPTIENYEDAVVMLALFGIGEKALTIEIGRGKPVNEAFRDVMNERNLDVPLLLPRQPKGNFLPDPYHTVVHISGPTAATFAPRELREAFETLPETNAFGRRQLREIREAPRALPAPAAIEIGGPTPATFAPRELRTALEQEGGVIEPISATVPPRLRLGPPEQPILLPEFQREVAPINLPGPVALTPILPTGPRTLRDSLQAFAEARANDQRRVADELTSTPKQMSRLRDFQEETDLARRKGTEEAPEPPVAAEVRQLRPDTLRLLEMRKERDIESAKAAKTITEEVNNVVESTDAAEVEALYEILSLESESAVEVRRDMAVDVANQIVDTEFINEGESVAQVRRFDDETGMIEYSIRQNDGTVVDSHFPISQLEDVQALDDFLEADARASAAIESTVNAKHKEMRLSGTISEIREFVQREIQRMREDDLGAIWIPGLGKFGKNKKPQKYEPSDVEQAAYNQVKARMTATFLEFGSVKLALNNPKLGKANRQRLETRAAELQEQLILYGEALGTAPVNTAHPNQDLGEMPFNELRRLASNLNLSVGKNPKKADLVKALSENRTAVRKRNSAITDEVTNSQAMSERHQTRVRNNRTAWTPSLRGMLFQFQRQISGGAGITRAAKEAKVGKVLDPYQVEAYSKMVQQTGLARGGSIAGSKFTAGKEPDIWGGLSRSHKDAMDEMAIIRSELGILADNPGLTTIPPRHMQVDRLNNIREQLGNADYVKLSGRIDRMVEAYDEVLQIAVDRGFVSTADASRMRQGNGFLPVRFGDLIDSDIMGIMRNETRPAPGLTRRRTNEATEAEQLERMVDQQVLFEDYMTRTFNNIFRNDLAQSMARFSEAVPNEFMRIAEQGEKPRGVETLIEFRDNGERNALIVDRNVSDAFFRASQETSTLASTVGWLTGARLTKLFATGTLGPEFFAVAFPRDFLHTLHSADQLGKSTYSSYWPGVNSARLSLDILEGLPSVMAREGVGRAMATGMQRFTESLTGKKVELTRDPLTDYIMAGGGHQMLSNGWHMTKNKSLVNYARTGSRIAVGNDWMPEIMRNGVVAAPEAMKNFIDALEYANGTAELSVRVGQYIRGLKNIAKDKNVKVEDLEFEDHQAAAYSARNRIDFADSGNVIRAMEEFVPYTSAATQALRGPVRQFVKDPKLASVNAMKLMTFPFLLYMLSRSNDEDRLKQLPSYVHGDLNLVLPNGLGAYTDDNGVKRNISLTLKVDQSLRPAVVLGHNLAAMAYGDEVDIDGMVAAAQQMVSVPVGLGSESGDEIISRLNFPINVRMVAEWYTNRSTVYRGMALFRGQEGGMPSAEIDPTQTSPFWIGAGETIPFISPQRQQSIWENAFPNRISTRLIGDIANKVSGIEDVRPPDRKDVPILQQFLVDTREDREALKAADEIRTLRVTEQNKTRATIGRLIEQARRREDEVSLTPEMISFLKTIPSDQVGQFKSQIERAIDFDTLGTTTANRTTWNRIMGENPAWASVTLMNVMANESPTRRATYLDDLKKIRASKMKSNSWFKQFNVFFQADRKEWETLTGEPFSEVNPSDLQSRLFELRRQSGLTAPAQ